MSKRKTHIQTDDTMAGGRTLCGLPIGVHRKAGITTLGHTYARLVVSPRFPKRQSYMCRTCVRNLFL